MTNPAAAARIPGKYKWAWLALLVCFGLFLRIPDHPSIPYSTDEAMHADIASGTTIADVLHYAQYETHPPLFYILLHFWMKLSNDPAFLRCFSLLTGMALIPLYYLIGRQMAGELGGLCCATLVALSEGCIIQSFMLRQYSVLLPFLSLCLYCYLCWHKSRGHAWLLSYVGFGLLASLSHFFAILFFASLTLFEAGDMLVRWHADGRKGKWGPPGLAQWLAANFVIAAFALLLYWHWQPSILSYQGYFTNYPESFFTRAAYGICIVFREAYYLFPMFPLLPAMMVYGIWRFQSSLRQAPHPLLLASVIAGLLCATLYALKQHPNPGGRHDLWMMPFILAAAGEMCATLLATKSRLQKAFIVIAAAGCVGAAVNECVQRYRYQGEVIGETQTLEEWQVEGQWQAIHKVLDSLGPHDLIDVTRRGGTQLTNIYASIKDDTFTAMRMAAIAPYENTHILFNPYYAADTNTGVMLSTLQEALNRSMLDDVDRLVFLQSPARLPAIALVMCDTLEKEIITAPALPAFPPDHVLQRSDLSGRAIIMLVSKQAIVDDVLNPDGKARSCLPAK